MQIPNTRFSGTVLQSNINPLEVSHSNNPNSRILAAPFAPVALAEFTDDRREQENDLVSRLQQKGLPFVSLPGIRLSEVKDQYAHKILVAAALAFSAMAGRAYDPRTTIPWSDFAKTLNPPTDNIFKTPPSTSP